MLTQMAHETISQEINEIHPTTSKSCKKMCGKQAHLILCIFELSQKIISYDSSMIGMDETKSIEAPTFRVTRARSNLFWQITLH